MNRKGQITGITIFFMLVVFVIVYAFFFADFLTTWGAEMVVKNNLSGFEAFFYDNLNAFVLFMVLIFTLAALAFGGGG